jgi:hypothetical protein
MLARQATFPAPPKQANPFPAMLLRTLCAEYAVPAPSFFFQLRTKRSNNAPVSPLSTAFLPRAKSRGTPNRAVSPLVVAFTPNALATPLESAFTKNTGVWGTGQFAISPRLTLIAQPQNRAPLNTFRMNTCKSVSKQSTLTIFRMNTYAKTGGEGPSRQVRTGRIPDTARTLATACKTSACHGKRAVLWKKNFALSLNTNGGNVP